ncbi:MAG TPA: UDP-N-acetylmuramoyl-tripeptide--D-alanyl-D-alanine ligase [Methylophilaceae bacterium]|nr:UDP-N-acetylmuramoyl-tripeptide--D-alanyl-D-alanine ligase [Methylophilaceae bacterium]
MMLRLSEAALATGGRVVGADAAFDAVSTDSRAIQAGDLFVALRGERFDGHDFAADCLQRGAAAAMVDARWQAGETGPLLVVEDTRLALGTLASYWRGKFTLPLAAITGSNGKTTVKEMLASILRANSADDAVLATQGNLNNDIGLPITLFKLHDAHRYAVIEMGMNNPGEISYLTRLAKPTVALINNALPAHLEGLGSVEAVAHAKGEIFEGLADDGTAIINIDDPFAPLWQQLAAPRKVLTFGLDHAADVSADYRLHSDSCELTLKTPQGEAAVRLPAPGVHNVRNALAAAAAAIAMDVSLSAIVSGLQQYDGVKGRLQRKAGIHGSTVIDDTYNANPASMRAAIDVLAACPGKRVLVLGDMGELGDTAAEMHREIGVYAKHAQLDRLLLLGELSKEMAAGFGAGAQHFESPEALGAELNKQLTADTTVLVKGSRFMRMERVVALLLAETTDKGSKHAA